MLELSKIHVDPECDPSRDAFLPVRFATRVAPAASALGSAYVTDPY